MCLGKSVTQAQVVLLCSYRCWRNRQQSAVGSLTACCLHDAKEPDHPLGSLQWLAAARAAAQAAVFLVRQARLVSAWCNRLHIRHDNASPSSSVLFSPPLHAQRSRDRDWSRQPQRTARIAGPRAAARSISNNVHTQAGLSVQCKGHSGSVYQENGRYGDCYTSALLLSNKRTRLDASLKSWVRRTLVPTQACKLGRWSHLLFSCPLTMSWTSAAGAAAVPSGHMPTSGREAASAARSSLPVRQQKRCTYSCCTACPAHCRCTGLCRACWTSSAPQAAHSADLPCTGIAPGEASACAGASSDPQPCCCMALSCLIGCIGMCSASGERGHCLVEMMEMVPDTLP